MLLAAGTVALFGHVSIANPLGDQFMDPRLGLMLLLISSTAAVLGLQSRVAEQLALSGPCRWRASWLLVLCGLHGVSTWQIAVDGRPPFGVLHIVAITFFFPVGLRIDQSTVIFSIGQQDNDLTLCLAAAQAVNTGTQARTDGCSVFQ